MSDTTQFTGVTSTVASKNQSVLLRPQFLVPALGVGYLIYNKKTRIIGLTIVGGFLYMLSQIGK
jgi:hypothetical protein